MKRVVSVVALIVVHFVAATLLTEHWLLSKTVAPCLAVVVAWSIDRQMRLVVVTAVLLVVAVVLPLALLVLALPATESITGNIHLLTDRMSFLEFVAMVGSVVVGYGTGFLLLKQAALNTGGSRKPE